MKFVFKITVIGDGGVGKTSLIKKYTKGEFEDDYISTIGAQFSIFDKIVDGDECKLFFWDIAGQDDFASLREDFYKDSKAAIIVFSLENNSLGKESLRHVTNWYNEIMKQCGDIPAVLFANKVDLIDKGTIDNGDFQNLLKDLNFIGIYRTSAKTGEHVNEAFISIINELHSRHKK